MGKQTPKKSAQGLFRAAVHSALEYCGWPVAKPIWEWVKQEASGVKNGWVLFTVILLGTCYLAVWGTHHFDIRRIPAEVKHAIPYDVVTNQLHDANERADTEKNQAKQEHTKREEAEKRAEDNELRYLNAQCSTNSHPTSLTLLDDIARVQKMASEIPPENHGKRLKILKLLSSLGDKQKQINRTTKIKNASERFYSLLFVTFEKFQANLEAYEKKHGEKAPIFTPLATLDDLITGHKEQVIVNGTNTLGLCSYWVGVEEGGSTLQFTSKGGEWRNCT